jgi:hypothetical protein
MTDNEKKNEMKPKYISKSTNAHVDAWQVQKGSPRPAWVVRSFHDLFGNGNLTPGTLVPMVRFSKDEAKESDWIVCLGGAYSIHSNEDFCKEFNETVP